MVWKSPVSFELVATDQSESYKTMGLNQTGLPLNPHPGAFGFKRAHHRHEGVDLYVPEGSTITAVEDGTVVAVVAFTGEHAIPPSPWWHNTWAVMIRGETGVVLYGELIPFVEVGTKVVAGKPVGTVTRVLMKDKDRPMTMLHLELYDHSVVDPVEWLPDAAKPLGLCDPTPYLLPLCKATGA